MIKIKTSSRNTVIGYNNSGIPLQRRSQADLIDLAIIGVKSGDPMILNLFEGKLPTLEELLRLKMSHTIEKETNGANKTINSEGNEGQ